MSLHVQVSPRGTEVPAEMRDCISGHLATGYETKLLCTPLWTSR